ncbi:hypothetical protein LCGC14_2929800 [marine sediment metagenome]|uniref:Uncharacterized protein n=1 Tax=marine sediment metagenome TaxID=412755 RepID=A0A0F8XLA0_9ZZZZ
MPSTVVWILIGGWFVFVIILFSIIIDIKRYPWKYGAKEK